MHSRLYLNVLNTLPWVQPPLQAVQRADSISSMPVSSVESKHTALKMEKSAFKAGFVLTFSGRVLLRLEVAKIAMSPTKVITEVESCQSFNTMYSDGGLFGFYLTAHPSHAAKLPEVAANEVPSRAHLNWLCLSIAS